MTTLYTVTGNGKIEVWTKDINTGLVYETFVQKDINLKHHEIKRVGSQLQIIDVENNSCWLNLEVNPYTSSAFIEVDVFTGHRSGKVKLPLFCNERLVLTELTKEQLEKLGVELGSSIASDGIYSVATEIFS